MPFRPSVLLLLPLLGLTQCLLLPDNVSMPEDKMPAATQTGANTAGCVVDGLTWVPRNNGRMMDGPPPAGGGCDLAQSAGRAAPALAGARQEH